MTPQRFELSTAIGGFHPDECATMPFTILDECRNHLKVPTPLHEQVVRTIAACEGMSQFVQGEQHPRNSWRKLIFEEAMMNLLIHGNRARADLQSLVKLTIEFQQQETGLMVAFTLGMNDHADTFDLDRVPDPTTDENIGRSSGRGILLMRRICKAVISQIAHEGGKTITYTWNEEPKKKD